MPGSICTLFSLVTVPVLTFLFTGRDTAITMNSVKIGSVSHAVVVLAELLVIIIVGY